MRRLVLGTVLFVALIVAGLAWSLRRIGAQPLEFPPFSPTLLALPLLLVAIYATDTWRYRLLAVAAGTPLTHRAALEASIANFFFSWLTPGAALGAPAAILVLHRRGVPLAPASLIAFGKSATGTLILLLLAFLALALGWGPAFRPAVIAPLATGAGIVVLVLALPVAASLVTPLRTWLARPRTGLRGRLAAGLGDAAERLAGLRPRALVGIFLSHLAYFAVFIAVAVILVAAFGARPLTHVAGASTVFTAFTYVAPTPGGAGLSEGAADLFFAGLLQPARALSAVLLFRGLTFYLQGRSGRVYFLAVGGRRFFILEKP